MSIKQTLSGKRAWRAGLGLLAGMVLGRAVEQFRGVGARAG